VATKVHSFTWSNVSRPRRKNTDGRSVATHDAHDAV
jgi:hypothetical protein